MRKWVKLSKGVTDAVSPNLRVLTYNILSPKLSNIGTMKKISKENLLWDRRCPLITQEIFDVFGLQEVEPAHYMTILSKKFDEYFSYYIKRTGDKPDGCCLFLRKTRFDVLDQVFVKFVDHAECDRDNVGIIALCYDKKLKMNAVFSTTHILFNSSRGYIKLIQMNMLLENINKLFKKHELSSNCPIFIMGDFNMTPFSGLYKFMVEGFIDLAQSGKENQLSGQNCGRSQEIKKYWLNQTFENPFSLKSSMFMHENSPDNVSIFHLGSESIVDYIFYGSIKEVGDKILPVQGKEFLEKRNMKSFLPNEDFPSDHVPLV
ncbi:Endonuclease/exonuclease/phosphatase, partial [Rozella allomycis CSF55]